MVFNLVSIFIFFRVIDYSPSTSQANLARFAVISYLILVISFHIVGGFWPTICENREFQLSHTLLDFKISIFLKKKLNLFKTTWRTLSSSITHIPTALLNYTVLYYTMKVTIFYLIINALPPIICQYRYINTIYCRCSR